VAKSQGRRRIRNVFGVPPSAVPRDPARDVPPRTRKTAPREPDFDIDRVRLKPPAAPRPRSKR